ncbi:MAG: hypothetical protein H6721_23660 [Sandaracinus sp.]|nr:hypothetical protein [Sandaracinus sp.]
MPVPRAHLRDRLRLVIAALVGLAVLLVLRWDGFADAGGFEASLVEALAERVDVDPSSALRFGEGGVLRYEPVIFRGTVEEGGPADLFFVEVRAAEDGTVLSTRHLSNLTRTSSADELAPQRVGPHHAVFVAKVGGQFDAVTMLDLRGEPEAVTHGWPARARAQNAITNLQETGRGVGFGRRRYAIRPASEHLELAIEEGRVRMTLDEGSVVELDPEALDPVAGAERVEPNEQEKGMPGTITWVVDSVRNLSFVGPEPIAWLESRVFAVKDYFDRAYYAAAGGPDTEAEVAAEMGVTEEEARQRAELSATDPELGWPPAPLEPIIDAPARGEGEWLAVVDDPFVKAYPNAPPGFATTFLQVDPERPFTRVYVIAWDPRQIQLRIMSGTQEPESATGETAPGMVPRDDETLERVVGGFNGGFQSLHGEFGMMSEGRVYLPPKPWAATVGVFDDGRVAMGSWSGPPEGIRYYAEEWATRQIPEGMVELRQNLTSVVEGDRWNPWRRWYWGAAPSGDDEQVYIDRSGLCLTREGFLVYFWGKSMGAEELGKAMLAARCVRGLHLDMNQRHTGFELYRTYRDAETLPEVGRRLRDEFEFDIDVPHVRGWRVRGRLLASSMTPMRFPRYIRRDARDFFYLTQRPVLPGPHLSAAAEGEGVFDPRGLPNAGWPHAFARAWLGDPPAEDGARTWIVRIDASRAKPGAGEGRVLGYLTGVAESRGPLGLMPEPRTVGRRWSIAPAAEGAVLRGESLASQPSAEAALGVDADGFLVYAERASDPTPLAARMAAAGVDNALALPAGARLAFALPDGTYAGADAYVVEVDATTALPFVAEERPATEVLFPDVEPRPYMYWGPMQDTRVRYLRESDRPSRFQAPEDTE